MLQLRRQLDLPPEALGAHPCGQLRRQQLDHHPPPQRYVVGQEHMAHAAPAELALDAVRRAKGVWPWVGQ
jgi:hypothetical protein